MILCNSEHASRTLILLLTTPLGIASAPALFQYTMDTILQGIARVTVT